MSDEQKTTEEACGCGCGEMMAQMMSNMTGEEGKAGCGEMMGQMMTAMADKAGCAEMMASCAPKTDAKEADQT